MHCTINNKSYVGEKLHDLLMEEKLSQFAFNKSKNNFLHIFSVLHLFYDITQVVIVMAGTEDCNDTCERGFLATSLLVSFLTSCSD